MFNQCRGRERGKCQMKWFQRYVSSWTIDGHEYFSNELVINLSFFSLLFLSLLFIIDERRQNRNYRQRQKGRCKKKKKKKERKDIIIIIIERSLSSQIIVRVIGLVFEKKTHTHTPALHRSERHLSGWLFVLLMEYLYWVSEHSYLFGFFSS